MARPTKYRKDFHPEDFIRLSKNGKTLAQIGLEWDINPETIREWGKKNPEFSASIKKGRALSEGWYINLGQAAILKEVDINPVMFIWMTKNLFKWSDKLDHGMPEEDRPHSRLSDEELEQKLEDQDES